MYKIVTLKEKELETFKGKIVSVLETRKNKIYHRNEIGIETYYGCDIELELTCLVEVVENEG